MEVYYNKMNEIYFLENKIVLPDKVNTHVKDHEGSYYIFTNNYNYKLEIYEIKNATNVV